MDTILLSETIPKAGQGDSGVSSVVEWGAAGPRTLVTGGHGGGDGLGGAARTRGGVRVWAPSEQHLA